MSLEKSSLECELILGSDSRRSNARGFILADSPVCVNIPLFIQDTYDNQLRNWLSTLPGASFQLEK